MPILPRPSSPAVAWRDFVATIRDQKRKRQKLLIALASVMMPVIIVTAFYHDANIKPTPRLIYVESWPASRTDAEIKAQQKIDEAKRQKRLQERRRQFQKVADMFGIDTSK